MTSLKCRIYKDTIQMYLFTKQKQTDLERKPMVTGWGCGWRFRGRDS